METMEMINEKRPLICKIFRIIHPRDAEDKFSTENLNFIEIQKELDQIYIKELKIVPPDKIVPEDFLIDENQFMLQTSFEGFIETNEGLWFQVQTDIEHSFRFRDKIYLVPETENILCRLIQLAPSETYLLVFGKRKTADIIHNHMKEAFNKIEGLNLEIYPCSLSSEKIEEIRQNLKGTSKLAIITDISEPGLSRAQHRGPDLDSSPTHKSVKEKGIIIDNLFTTELFPEQDNAKQTTVQISKDALVRVYHKVNPRVMVHFLKKEIIPYISCKEQPTTAVFGIDQRFYLQK